MAHGHEAVLEAPLVVCVNILEETFLCGHLQHLIRIDFTTKVVVYGVTEPVNTVVASGVDLN